MILKPSTGDKIIKKKKEKRKINSMKSNVVQILKPYADFSFVRKRQSFTLRECGLCCGGSFIKETLKKEKLRNRFIIKEEDLYYVYAFM